MEKINRLVGKEGGAGVKYIELPTTIANVLINQSTNQLINVVVFAESINSRRLTPLVTQTNIITR